jgi:hypothetical protein
MNKEKLGLARRSFYIFAEIDVAFSTRPTAIFPIKKGASLSSSQWTTFHPGTALIE